MFRTWELLSMHPTSNNKSSNILQEILPCLTQADAWDSRLKVSSPTFTMASVPHLEQIPHPLTYFFLLEVGKFYPKIQTFKGNNLFVSGSFLCVGIRIKREI